MDKYLGIHGRNMAAEDIYTQIHQKQPSSILILGRHGSGKKYVLEKVAERLQKQHDFSILKFAGDQIVEQGEKYALTQREFELNFSVYIGLSWTSSEKNNSKMDYLLNCLKKVGATHIVLLVPDLEECHSEAKEILGILLHDKLFIEEQLSKTVTILTSTCDSTPIGSVPIDTITLPDYTFPDIREYVESILHYHPQGGEFDAKYKKLYEICGSDFSLVNLLYRDLFENDLQFSYSLESLVSQKMEHLKRLGDGSSIEPKDIEEIIMTCSLSVEYFSRFEISKAAERPEEIVNESVQLSISESLFKEVETNLFDFTSPDVKGVLEEKMIAQHNTRLLSYYNYLTQYRTDEYYLRAYYMIKYDKTITENSYSLLILAIEQAFMFNDRWIEEKVRKFIEAYGSQDAEEQYDRIIRAYRYHKNHEYQQSLYALSDIGDLEFGRVGRIELARLKFKNYYLLAQTASFDCKQALSSLKEAVQNPLLLEAQEGLLLEEERIFKLKIIYDIAPYVLDAENDYDGFQKLYDEARCILAKEGEKSSRKKTVQYINSIFNRKAFLFANPMAAMPYYDDAKAFFRKNCIWDEYCITLASQAGTCLACHQYKEAVKLCEEAYKKMKENHVTIPKREKLDNNHMIANFLLLEEQSIDAAAPEKKARQTARELEQMAVGPACGTKHVLLTNAASLYLYSNELEHYRRIKETIEASLACDDVSDLRDDRVNDFYRYHFAWFELFYHMQQGEWAECEEIMNRLNGFIPALFKKQESLWQEKNKAASLLIKHRTTVTGYQFSLHLVKTNHRETDLAQFYHRGLMLSDLQYTSYN